MKMLMRVDSWIDGHLKTFSRYPSSFFYVGLITFKSLQVCTLSSYFQTLFHYLQDSSRCLNLLVSELTLFSRNVANKKLFENKFCFQHREACKDFQNKGIFELCQCIFNLIFPDKELHYTILVHLPLFTRFWFTFNQNGAMQPQKDLKQQIYIFLNFVKSMEKARIHW